MVHARLLLMLVQQCLRDGDVQRLGLQLLHQLLLLLLLLELELGRKEADQVRLASRIKEVLLILKSVRTSK